VEGVLELFEVMFL